VELLFATKNYASKLSKSADVLTNDPIQPAVKIMFTAQIMAGPDSTSACRHTPDIVEFAMGGQKSQSVVFSNHGDSVLHLAMVSTPPKALDIKNKPFALKPTEIKKLDFKWKGTFAENDSNISLTFEIQNDSTRRFTIPVVIKGTKPPEPKPTPIEKSKTLPASVKPVEPIKKEPVSNPPGKKWPVSSDTTRPDPGIKKQ
jgi:hypothetical protein